MNFSTNEIEPPYDLRTLAAVAGVYLVSSTRGTFSRWLDREARRAGWKEDEQVKVDVTNDAGETKTVILPNDLNARRYDPSLTKLDEVEKMSRLIDHDILMAASREIERLKAWLKEDQATVMAYHDLRAKYDNLVAAVVEFKVSGSLLFTQGRNQITKYEALLQAAGLSETVSLNGCGGR